MKTNKHEKSLVIGCTNGVGYDITLKLLSEGHQVIGVDRDYPSTTDSDFHFLKCNISSADDFSSCLSVIDLSTVKSIFFTAGVHSTLSASNYKGLSIAEDLMRTNFYPHIVLMQEVS